MKKLLVVSCLVFGGLFSQAFASYCELEKATLKSLKVQLDSLETQLNLSKTDSATTAVNGIGTVALLYLNLKGGDGFKTRAYLGVMLSAAAVHGYNFYVNAKDILFYQEIIKQVKKDISDKEFEIDKGLCVSNEVNQITDNQSVSELYENLVKLNNTLSQAIIDLNKQLGNALNKTTTTIQVPAAILLTAGFGMMRVNYNNIPLAGFLTAALGTVVNGVSQAVDVGALTMSSKEARKLLQAVSIEHNNLKEQEDLLRAVLASRK